MKRIVGSLVLAVMLGVFVVIGDLGAAHASDPEVSAQVVGGHNVSDGKYGFVAAILYEPYGPPIKSAYCMGSLIDSDTVITAAHCLRSIKAQKISVTVGRTVLSDKGQGYVGEARSRVIHPAYGHPCSDCHDVGDINLTHSITDFKPIAIGEERMRLEGPHRDVLVAGFGSTNPTGTNYPDRMHAAQVDIVGDERSRNLTGPHYRKSLMVGALGHKRDTCFGDSGGPLFDATPRLHFNYKVCT
jgi:trypsin